MNKNLFKYLFSFSVLSTSLVSCGEKETPQQKAQKELDTYVKGKEIELKDGKYVAKEGKTVSSAILDEANKLKKAVEDAKTK
jgi:hypothetical protein